MAAKTKKFAGTGAAPATRVQAVQNLRRSGAAGSHDTRQRGLRDRKGAKSFAIRDSSY